MKKRVRVQPYVLPGVRQRLAAYSAAQGLTESAVIEAALVEYLARGYGDEGPVVRRLDLLTQSVTRLQDDLAVVGGAVGRFIRFSLRLAPPALPEGAEARGGDVYRRFLSAVASELATGVTFVGTIRRAREKSAQSASPSANGGG